MSGEAIIMMLVATCTIWGGLMVAITNLLRHPAEPDDDEVEVVTR